MNRKVFLKILAGGSAAAVLPAQTDNFYESKGITLDREGNYQGSTILYTVRENETLFQIAERFLGDPYKAQTLAKLNNISDPLRLTPGRKIKIPRPKLALRYTIYRLNGEDVEAVGANYRFKAGDKFQVRLSANVDGYLYLFNRDADGGITPLFPYEGRKAARIRQYSEYLLPNNEWFRFDRQEGNEELLVLVSLEPLETLERARREGAPERSRRAMRDALDNWFSEASMAPKGIVVDRRGDEDADTVLAGDSGDSLILVHKIRLRRM